MQIAEIFESVQGEGSHMGEYVTFIRTAGCSLRCDFCDSKYTWAVEGAESVSPIELASRVKTQSVVITGGEPTEQFIELEQLIEALHEKGCYVMLESNGTYEWYADLKADWITVSPKAKSMYVVYPSGVDELKYVVTEEFNDKVAIPEGLRNKFVGRIWLQPCDYGDEEKNKAMIEKALEIVKSDSRLRLGIQAHKVWNVR